MERGEVIIDRMLVVVFETESKAYEGRKALLRLENEAALESTPPRWLPRMQMGP